ncbi:GNAT family N-acetyltransferase [Nonomuraea sp. NPDC050790]|uniref:GNAT family N-acetyltransferase n=1 Tax=Nonomuraea sp. NPDC050790 TaxID=3364371 RepID=UPI003793B1BF
MHVIRPVTEADLPAVTDIYAHYVLTSVATFEVDPPELGFWRAKADLGLPFLVAEVDGEVGGFAYAGQYRPRPGYRHSLEDSLYLAPGFTGRGLGRALLEALVAACRERGARQLIAVVADGGDPASDKLHRALGFQEAGRLRGVGFKHGRWLDTVLLQLDLT